MNRKSFFLNMITKPTKKNPSASKLIAMQEALRQSEELHRIILTNISDSVFLTDDLGNFTFICPNVDNIFGYSFEEIYKMKNISRLIGDDIYDPERLTKAGELRNIEKTITDKNGASHIVLINVKRVLIKYGSRLFTCRDITEYKRVKQELSKNIQNRKKVEKDLVLIFNLSGDLFSIMDKDLIHKFNPGWTTTLGYKVEELLGKPISQFVHPDDLDLTQAIEKRMTAGAVVQFENRMRHKDGSYRWLSWNSTMSDDGQIISVGRDVTAKKKEEDEIKRRLLKFKLQPGRTYLVKDHTPVNLAEAFKELLDIHYSGLAISRHGREFFSELGNNKFDYMWLADRGGVGTIKPNPLAIEHAIEGLHGEHVIAIDGLEFLAAKRGMSEVLSLVSNLRELAFFNNHIILLGVDQNCLSRKDMSFIEKETLEMERYPEADLSEDAIALLRKVYERNSHGIKPTRTDLCRDLGISHPTVRKRIADLLAMEFLWEARSGRSTVVEMTEKGRRAINL
jgi:PAS domain S-box-containing protein